MLVIVQNFLMVMIDRLKLTQNLRSIDIKRAERHSPGNFNTVSDNCIFLLLPLYCAITRHFGTTVHHILFIIVLVNTLEFNWLLMCRIYLSVCCVLPGDANVLQCDKYRVSICISTLIRDCKTDGTEAYLIIIYKH